MFKKILAIVAIVLFMFCGMAQAARVASSQIMDTTFNAVTISDTSDTVAIAGYDKVTFFVVYNETEVGESISAAITLDVSYDGTNWLTGMSFYDLAGVATLQTSETISSNSWYVFWLNKDICVPYVRVAVAATGTDADDLLDIQVYISAKE